ncbi:hypothetical protein [Neorhizobium huautlense]|uniref:hypothetical protein n=1 Tax=Neorhizobium huautlense TaxID=67774 RepID=UPI001FDEF716|nr:hypothetical protein [Neorhizobium huautlense]
MNKSPGGAVLAVTTFLVGTAGGYAINEVIRSGHETEHEHEIARLKDGASQKTKPDVPSDEEASAVLAQSARRCAFRNAIRVIPCRV